ncbi:MAG: hypothetical protein JSS69_02125 [Acidobacteria bacterium]|nr:hypothetical protein [Acidobacteriota bacterium]MBS1864690.1 hypothetical protein [Acidobacteriota bacterium]
MNPGPVYLAILFSLIVGAVQGELTRRSKQLGSALFLWLAVTGVLSLTPMLHDFSQRPPRIMLLVVLSFVGVYFGSKFSAAAKLIETPGLAWLIGFQVFRVAVEIFLYLGHRAGFVPVQMTFEGRNWDVFTGLTALPMAWLVAKNKAPKWLIYAWNTIGLALLLNVTIVAALSMPTPLRHFHSEPANMFVTYFPYIWLPTYLVQVAWLSHLLIFRAARALTPKAAV